MDAGLGTGPYPEGGWPANELEQVLVASVGVAHAGPRIAEVLARSPLWIPLPSGGDRSSTRLDLPTVELGGQAYVPVFSSEAELLRVAGPHTSYTVAPAVEFARGLPPQVGLAVNPDGTVGAPLPPQAVAELALAGRTVLDGPATGGRVRLYEPDWQLDPVDFLSAAATEFAALGVVHRAFRCLAEVETGDPVLFIGVEPAVGPEFLRELPLEALGRALGQVPVAWPVNLIRFDLAEDPVVEWMRARVRPFYVMER